MCTLSLTQQNQILSMLDAGHSAAHIASYTGYGVGTISRFHSKHCSHLSKPVGGHPSKPSSTNIHHAVHLIGSGKASTAVDMAKTISNINKRSLYAQTMFHCLNEGCGGGEEASSLTEV